MKNYIALLVGVPLLAVRLHGAQAEGTNSSLAVAKRRNITAAEAGMARVNLQSGTNTTGESSWRTVQLPKLRITTNGAIGNWGPVKVFFAANLNSAGAVTVRSEDGRTLKTTILGLSYYDSQSGKSVLLAETKDTTGELTALNELTFRDAFTDFKADVRYQYFGNSLEQDVILRERPPSPADFGLNPATARLEVLTEFPQTPATARKSREINLRADGLTTTHGASPVRDDSPDFGAMRIIRGKAFGMGADGRSGATVPVARNWEKMEGRDFLIEAVDYPTVSAELQKLPTPKAGAALPARKSNARMAGFQRTLPAPRLARATRDNFRYATAALSAPGQGGTGSGAGPAFVIDYIIAGVGITNTIWVDDAVPADSTVFVGGPGPGGEEIQGTENGWWWTNASPAALSGSSNHVSIPLDLEEGSFAQHGFYDTPNYLTVASGEVLYAYVYLDPNAVPTGIRLEWMSRDELWDEESQEFYYENNWEHRAYWGAADVGGGTDGTASLTNLGTIPPAGQWVRLEVPASVVGFTNSANLAGMAFTVVGGNVTWDAVGKLNTSPDTTWVNDEVPGGAWTYTVGGDSWAWVTNNPLPQLGTSSHHSASNSGMHEHVFNWATNTLAVSAGDTLYTYIYLDPTNTPTEIMLQWSYNDTGNLNWEHRAYWGSNTIVEGITNTDSRRYLGPLPPSGQWVRLEVPAEAVGLEGKVLVGMVFELYDGAAYWDNAGVSRLSASDADSDGLPDWWEINYWGSVTSQNGTGDPDGDGVSNLLEYLQGSDPTKGRLADTSGVVNLLVFPPLR